ncbi:MAG: TIGR00268 family protein, partial [Bacillota bacterium]|nr:TIGR00268 family protein [Bacillota bacterium]
SADKPANACTLTRIPHDTPIEPEDLRRIEEAEGFLATLGYRGFRVRKHGEIARIEGDIRAEDRPIVCDRLRSIGFRYVTVDLAGYQKGWGK